MILLLDQVLQVDDWAALRICPIVSIADCEKASGYGGSAVFVDDFVRRYLRYRQRHHSVTNRASKLNCAADHFNCLTTKVTRRRPRTFDFGIRPIRRSG